MMDGEGIYSPERNVQQVDIFHRFLTCPVRIPLVINNNTDVHSAFFAFASACITSGSVKEYAIILMELSALLIVSSTRADALPSGEKPTFTDGVSIIANDGVVNSNGHASSDTRSRVTIVFLPDIKTPEFNRGQSSLVVIPYGGDTTMDDRRRWPLSEC